MRRRLLLVALGGLTLCLGAVAGGAAWVLRTDAGAAWALARALGATDGALAIEGVRGSFAGGLAVARVRWRAEGWSVSADDVSLRAHPTFFPLGARIEGLRVGKAGFVTTGTSAPTATEVSLSPLPVALELDDVEIGPLTLNGEPAWRRAAGSVCLDDKLVLRDVTADTALGPATLQATLGFTAPWALAFETSARLAVAEGEEPVALSARGDGDAGRLQVSAAAEALGITAEGVVEHPLTGPVARLTIIAPGLAWPPRDDAPAVRASDVTATFDGGPEAFSWSLQATVDALAFEGAAFRARGTSRPTGLEATELALTDAHHELAGSGRLDWGEDIALGVDLAVAELAPEAWLGGWQGERVHGAAKLAWDGTGLALSDALLEGRETSLRLAADGRWDATSDRLNLALEWRDLAWPAHGDAAQVTSESGKARAEGRLAAWNAVAEGQLSVQGFPGGRVTAEAGGNQDGAELTRLDIDAMGGRARGDGRVAWGEDGAWRARLTLEGVHARALWPELTGPVDGRLVLGGDWRSGAFRAETGGLAGEFRGRPVALRGAVAREESGWRFEALHAESGDTVVDIDGAPWGAGASVRAVSVVAEDWTELAAGTVDADFRVSLNPEEPGFEGELRGQAMRVGGLAAERLSLSGSLRPGPGGAANLDLAVAELRQDDNLFGQVRGSYVGDGAQRNLAMDVTGESAAFRLRGTGAFDRARGGAWRWRGVLRQASLEATWPEFDGFDLRAPAGVVVGPGLLELDEACLAADDDGAICLAASGAPDGRLAATVDLERWPMDSVSSVLALDVRPSQSLTGHATLTLDALALVATTGALEISQGRVRRTDVTARPLRTEAGRLEWSTAPDRALEVALDLPVVDAGTVRGSFRLAPPLGLDSALGGALNLGLVDLSPLAAPFPAIDEMGGSLEAQLDLGGTLGEPAFAGAIDLSGGLVEYQPLGLRVTDIELDGRFAANEPAELSGRFRSGDGAGRIEARLAEGDGAIPQLVLRFSGEQITLADLPEARIVGTPDLRLTVRGQRTTLDGTLQVPYARLVPREDPSVMATESDDVVIVGAEPEDEATQPTGPVELTGDVRVTLGDDVRMSLAGADTRIDGEVALRWTAQDVIPVADGKFNVEGQYKAYGQLLEIAEGAVNFPGVPADDPNLDIRAERQIFGNREVDAAGVWITGTAQRPELQLYTEPPTSDERALSFVVTGSDFDYADGVGQLTVGTYVLPRLFVSYGRGLFEDINVVSGRFDISEHWGIKGSSSERESGVDLTYTIDK